MKSHIPSLRRTLLVTLMSTMLLVWSGVLVQTYIDATHEIEEVYDADLARTAHVLARILVHEVEEERNIHRNLLIAQAELGEQGRARYPKLARMLAQYGSRGGTEFLPIADKMYDLAHKYENKIALIARYKDGTVMMASPNVPSLPKAATGYFDHLGQDTRWRVFGLTLPDTGFNVQVAEKQEVRDELVNYITWNSIGTQLIALPFMALLIWLGIGHGLRPLNKLVGAIDQRESDSLEPVSLNKTPREIRPLILALNQLFGRVMHTLDSERRFTADAAHELRSPLSALKTHIQVTQKLAKDEQVRTQLDQATKGIDRASHLINQLLALSRADNQGWQDAGQFRTVDLPELAREMVEQFTPLALERHIDLGLQLPDQEDGLGPSIRGDRDSLIILLRNLVDNALRYCPEGSEISIQVTRDERGVWLAVIDDGPGVPATERSRLFERFHRGSAERSDLAQTGADGSGLGLSIVQRIAEHHAARVVISDGLDGKGLRVAMLFPNPT